LKHIFGAEESVGLDTTSVKNLISDHNTHVQEYIHPKGDLETYGSITSAHLPLHPLNHLLHFFTFQASEISSFFTFFHQTSNTH
jgi:hypothetical protein